MQIKEKSGFSRALKISELFTPGVNLRTVKFEVVDNKEMIWDPCRKKYVLHTPEEYVRQSTIEIIHQHYQYPLNKIAVEREFTINGRSKRFDLLLFNKDNTPFILIECKAPHIPLNESVFDQIARYHYVVKADYLAVTNGKNLLVSCVNESGSWIMCEDLPTYS